MGVNPGNLAFSMPPAEDDQVRKQRDMERQMRENAASVPRSFETTVAFLSSLQTLVSADADMSWTTFNVPYSTGTASITTTTTEPLLARVTYTAQVFTYARSGTTAQSGSGYWGAVAMNGAQIDGAAPVGVSTGPAGTLNVVVSNEFTFICDRIAIVPAGTNVFTHQYRGQAFVGAGTGGAAEGDRTKGILVVQFIGRP